MGSFQLNPEQQDAFDGVLEFIGSTEKHKEQYATISGKAGCLALGTKVIMFDGTLKNVEDIEVGHNLMGIDGTPRTVLSLCRGIEQMYWIHQSNGISYRVNEKHILSLVGFDETIINIDVLQYLKNSNIQKEFEGYRPAFLPNSITFRQNNNKQLYITSKITVEKDIIDDYYGFVLDGDHLFLLEDFTVTHNTGKTVCGAELVDRLPTRRFIVAAISHKAKEVIASRISGRNVKAMTIASLLAMKLNEETGEFFEDPFENDLPIADADIVIIDEASMIHEKTVKYIFQKKLTRTVIIFMGDIGQIRPIKKNSKLNEVSPIFNTPNFFQLVTRVRQGEGNPILAHMDYFWDMTRNPKPNLKLEDVQKQDEINDIGAILYRNNMYQVIDDYLHYFKTAIEDQNTNILKIVTYTNETRHFLNDIVRKRLYGEQEADENQFFVGELMIMADTYNNDFNKVENSTEFAVTSFVPSSEDIGDYTFRTFELVGVTKTIRGDRNQIRMTVLDRRDKDMFDRFVAKLFAQAAEAKGLDRKNAYREAWAAKNRFAKADYGYSISAHKSQGSTYDRVIVNLTNMMNAFINDQEKASLIYTAGTRARFEVVMVNKNFVL